MKARRAQRKQWSDGFTPEIKKILQRPEIKGALARFDVGTAAIEEDMKRNTDLMVISRGKMRIGCRVRQHRYYHNYFYRGQITIRSGYTNGSRTELGKILDGWGDYFFYAFANEDDTGFEAWTLCDLEVFRLWFAGKLAGAKGNLMPGVRKENHSGETAFRVFNLDNLPESFVVSRYDRKEEQRKKASKPVAQMGLFDD